MASRPTILSPREPFTDSQGNVTRSWWRSINDLFSNWGTLASPLVVQPSALLNGGTITSGGTISAPDLPPGSLIGNGGTTAGQPGTLALDPSLSLANGTITVAPLPPGVLSGNPKASSAPPGPVEIGSGLSLTASGTLLATGATDDEAALYSIRDTRGEIAALDRKVNDALILALLPPSPEVPSSASPGVTEIIIAKSAFLNAGTITSIGTISSPTLAATGLLGGTIGAQATNIALGPVFGFSGNTLEYTGTLVVAPSAFLNAGTIVGSGTISSPTLAAQSLVGNSGTIGAAASAIALGTGFSFTGNTLEFAGGGGGALTIENGGASIGTATTLNAGAGMTATLAGSVATLTATGGGGGGGGTDTFIYPTFAATTTSIVGQTEFVSPSTWTVNAGDSYKIRYVGTRATLATNVGFSILNAAGTLAYTFVVQNDGNIVMYRFSSSTNNVLSIATGSLANSFKFTQGGTFIIEAQIAFSSIFNMVEFLNMNMPPVQDNGINFVGSTFGVGAMADTFSDVGKFQIQKIS